MPGNIILGSLRPIFDPSRRDKVHSVALTTHHVTGHVIGYDPVRFLGCKFGLCIRDDVTGLGRESYEQDGAIMMGRKRGQYVRIGREA